MTGSRRPSPTAPSGGRTEKRDDEHIKPSGTLAGTARARSRRKMVPTRASGRRRCAHPVRDSSSESSVVAGLHEQAEAPDLPHRELASRTTGRWRGARDGIGPGLHTGIVPGAAVGTIATVIAAGAMAMGAVTPAGDRIGGEMSDARGLPVPGWSPRAAIFGRRIPLPRICCRPYRSSAGPQTAHAEARATRGPGRNAAGGGPWSG